MIYTAETVERPKPERQRSMSRLPLPSVFILVLLWLATAALSTAPATAQQTETQQTESTGAPPAGEATEAEQQPQPITVTDIPERSEDLAVQLREIDAHWDETIVDENFTARLDKVVQEIADQQQETDALNDSTASSQLFDRHLQIWQSKLNALQSPDFELTRFNEQATADLDSLAMETDLWTLTRDASQETELPESIKQRIDENLASLDAIKDRVLARRDTLLTIQDRIVRLRGTCRENLASIETAQEAARNQLLTTGIKPLWSALQDSPSWRHAWAVLIESVELQIANARTHFELHATQVIIRLCFLPLVAVFFIYLRRRARLFAAYDESMQKWLVALERPISAAVLVVVLINALLDTKIRDVADFILLLLIIPLLRLVPKLISERVHGALYSLAVIYIIDWMADFFPAETLISRLLMLLCCAITITTLWWLRRPLRQIARETTALWPRLMISYSRLAMTILIVAVVTDVLGNPLLAEVLINGTLASLYAGILLWATVSVLQGMIVVLLRSTLLQRLRIVHLHGDELKQDLYRILVIVARVAWLYVTLRAYGVFRPALAAVMDFLSSPLVIGSAAVTPGDILILIVVIWLSFVVSRLVRFVLEKDVMPRLSLARGVPATVSRLTHYIILFVGFLLAVSAAGLDMGRFTVIAGAFGVGIGFGLQNVVNNFVSGLILLFERPIQLGDRIQVGEMICVVKSIGMRASTVRTFDGAEVIVPNGLLVSNEVTNWTLSDRQRRIKIPIGVAYGTDTGRVLEILAEVAKQHPQVLTTPSPDIYFVGFGESSLDFSLRVWVDQDDDWLQIRSDVCAAVDKAFAEQGIVIPFPQHDLHLRSVDSGLGPVLTVEGGAPTSGSVAPQAPQAPQPKPPATGGDTRET